MMPIRLLILLINMCSLHHLITIPSYGNEQMGYLVPLDTEKIPFDIKRMFYLVDVPSQMTRGKHAYRKLNKFSFVYMER